MNQTELSPFLADPGPLPKSQTLLRESGLRVMLLHLKSGERIPEHHAPGAITVHCLQGEVDFFVAGAKVELRAGTLIGVEPKAQHRLNAHQESLVLVTLWEQVP